jgi:hypothetical protein
MRQLTIPDWDTPGVRKPMTTGDLHGSRRSASNEGRTRSGRIEFEGVRPCLAPESQVRASGWNRSSSPRQVARRPLGAPESALVVFVDCLFGVVEVEAVDGHDDGRQDVGQVSTDPFDIPVEESSGSSVAAGQV